MKETNPNFDFYSFNEKTEQDVTPAEEKTVEPATEEVAQLVEEATTAPAGEPVDEQAAAAPSVDTALLKSKMKNGYSHVGWAFVAVTFAWFFLTIMLQVFASVAAPWLYDTYWFEIVSGTLPLYVVCTPLLFLIVQGAQKAQVEKKKLSVPHFFMLLLIAEGIMVVGSLIGNGLMSTVSLLTGNDFENQLNSAFEIPIWLSFAFTVVLAPIFEELIFRKLLLDRMLPYGEFCAILINGILFGAFHGNFFQFFYAAMLGVLLSFVYVKTGKLRHCILIHMCVNFLGGIVPTLLYDWLGYDRMLALMNDEQALAEYIGEHILPYFATMAYSAFQYGCAIAGAIVLILNLKKIKLRRTEDTLSNKEGLGAAFKNSGMIAALVVCGLLFVMSLFTSAA